MKHRFTILFMFFIVFGFSQTPELVNYQAVIRDSVGQILSDQQIDFQLSILKGSALGLSVYEEVHNVTTNDFGQVAIQIGGGTTASGNFSSIDWGADEYYLETAIDIDGLGSFTVMGTSQLVSVPYALNSKRTESLILTDPNGNQYEVIVDTLGNLSTEPIVNAEAIGWTKERYDLNGSNYYPYGSSIQTSQIIESWNYTFSSTTWGTILTGNVFGDENLEIVTVQNNYYRIFSSEGILLINQDVEITGVELSYLSMLDDFDNDGLLDAGIAYKRNYFNNGNGYARIYNGQGALINEFVNNDSYDGHTIPITILNDKLIIAYAAYYSNNPRGFSSWDIGSSNELWLYIVGPPYRGYSIADIDNDNIFELAYSNFTSHNGASGNGTTDGDNYTIIIDESGNSILTEKYSAGNSNGRLYDYFVKFNPSISNYNLVSFKAYSSSYTGDSKIHIRELDGSYLYNYTGLHNGFWAFGWEDIDSDNITEIVASNNNSTDCELTIFDEQLNVQQTLSMPQNDYYFNAIADVNGDGNEEIIVSSSTDKIVAGYDNSLNQIWSWTNPSVSNIRKVIVSDNDLDGKLDVCVLTDGAIYMLSGTN